MTRIVIGGVIATTHPLPSYGGIQLAREALVSLAESMRARPFRFQAHHDPRLAIDVEVQAVEVRNRDDGFDELWVEFEVEEEDWRSTAGDARGFSYTGTIPHHQVREADRTDALVVVRADDAHFGPRVLDAVLAQGQAAGLLLETHRAFQFNAVPPPSVIIDFTQTFLLGLGSGLSANALYDLIKTHLLRSKATKAPSRVTFTVTDGDRSVDATIETADPEILKQAMGGLAALHGSGKRTFGWDTARRVWQAIR